MGSIAKTNQVCYRCGMEKPLIEFIRRIDNRYYNMCKSCVSEIMLISRSRKRQKLKHTETQRTCYLCNRFLPNAEFTRRSNGTYFSACKSCNRHVFAQRRRARLLASEGTYTVQEWETLLSKHPTTCPGCGRLWNEIPVPAGRTHVITVDHIIPISRGGKNSIDNLQPLCYTCNSKKGNKT